VSLLIKKRLVAGLATFGLLVGAGFQSTPASAQTANEDTAISTLTETKNGQKAEPAVWHLVLRILMTKAGCENVRRLMPNKGDLKCIKAGKVWVLIPIGRGW
jgi:hypothetical protein